MGLVTRLKYWLAGILILALFESGNEEESIIFWLIVGSIVGMIWIAFLR